MTLAELQQLLTAADPAAVLVSPRVLDRVIQEAWQRQGLAWAVPHRHCFVVDRHVLFRFVEQDDLILESHQLLPPTVILLARPGADELAADPYLCQSSDALENGSSNAARMRNWRSSAIVCAPDFTVTVR